MQKVNDYEFAKHLDTFEETVIKRLEASEKDYTEKLNDEKRQWLEEDKKKVIATRDRIAAQKEFYTLMHFAGKALVKQHEALVNDLCKWYATWYDNISNEGRQEAELMAEQADMLNDIFVEIYKIIEPLKLEISPPKALNL